VVRVRFERDVRGRAARTSARLFERERFGVLQIFIKVNTFADDLARARDDAADERTRADKPDAARREFERATHQPLINVRERGRVWSLESGVWSQNRNDLTRRIL
jgi:hypothetical protein